MDLKVLLTIKCAISNAIACNYLVYINLKIKKKERKNLEYISYTQDFMSTVQYQNLVKLEMLKLLGGRGVCDCKIDQELFTKCSVFL